MRKYDIVYDYGLGSYVVWEVHQSYQIDRFHGTKKNCISWVQKKKRNNKKKRQIDNNAKQQTKNI